MLYDLKNGYRVELLKKEEERFFRFASIGRESIPNYYWVVKEEFEFDEGS